jgi:hypothetical protein
MVVVRAEIPRVRVLDKEFAKDTFGVPEGRAVWLPEAWLFPFDLDLET